MIVHIKFLSQTRKATGCDELTIRTSGPVNVNQTLDHLCSRFPELDNMRSSLLVVRNQVNLSTGDEVADQDQLTLIPPF